MVSPMKYFAGMPDHRHPSYIIHPLPTIIGITIAAVICGAQDWYDVEDYGIEKKEWLGQFLDVSNGIPSHDTFNLFFRMADATELEACFERWVAEVVSLAEGCLISIDGKTLRGSSAGKEPGSFLHMVSAWCSDNHLVLAQQKVDDKSNEITAIPALLELLVVKGCLVTIDAMGCQVKIAEKIVDRQADYLLAVKENQEVLLDDMREAFSCTPAKDSYKHSQVGHGRVETRITSVITDTDWICNQQDWKNLCSLIKVEARRYDKKSGKEQNSERYFISSKKATAAYFHQAARMHWQIENNLHWMLDVIFGEDDSTKRAGNAAQNFSLINKVALNMIANHKDPHNRGAKKISAKRKRNMAAWNNDYLLQILLSLNYSP
jgi:predicted transposase YbfD/YdcC